MSKSSRFHEDAEEDWDFDLIDALVDAERRRKEALQASKENTCPGSSGVGEKAGSSSIQAPSDTPREAAMTRRSSSQIRRSSASKGSRKQHDLASRYGSLHPPQSQESTRSIADTPLRDAPNARFCAASLYPTPSRLEPAREPEGFLNSLPQARGAAMAMLDEGGRTPSRGHRQSVVSPVGVLGFNGMPNRQRPDPVVAPDEAPTSTCKGSGWTTDANGALHDEPAPTEPAPYLSQDRRTSAPRSFLFAEHDEEMEVDAGSLFRDHPEQPRAAGGQHGDPSRVPSGKQGSLVDEERSPATDTSTWQATASSFSPNGRSQFRRPPTQIVPSTGSHPVNNQWRSTRDSSVTEARQPAALPVPLFAEPESREHLHGAEGNLEKGHCRQGPEEARQRGDEELCAQAGQAVPEMGPQEHQMQQSKADATGGAGMGPQEAETGRRGDISATAVQHAVQGLRSFPLHDVNQVMRHAWEGRLTDSEAMPDVMASGMAHWLTSDSNSRGPEQSGSPLVYRLWTRCPDSLSVFLGDATRAPWEQRTGSSAAAGPGRGGAPGAGTLQYEWSARTGVNAEDSAVSPHPSKRMCKVPQEPHHSHHQLSNQVHDTVLKVWHHQLPPQALLESLMGAVERGLGEGKSGDLQGQHIICSALDVVHHLVQLSPSCCKELCIGAGTVNAQMCGPQSGNSGPGPREGSVSGTPWPRAGDQWETVHSAGLDAGGNPTAGMEEAAQDRSQARTVRKGRVLLRLPGGGGAGRQGSGQRPQVRREGGDTDPGWPARRWWVLLCAGCSSGLQWEGRASALGAIFVAVASTDPVQQRAIFEHLLTRRVVTALLGKSQPASLRLKALSMAQLLAACPALLPHFLHTSPCPLPSLEDAISATAGTSRAHTADRQGNVDQGAPVQAQEPVAVQQGSGSSGTSGKWPKHSALSQLVSCVADANLVLALEALRVLCELSSLYGPWVLLTCSSSVAHRVSDVGQTRGSRTGDLGGDDAAGAVECRPACHAVHEILAATEKCLGAVYSVTAEGVSGRPGAAVSNAKLPWAVLVLALECIAQVFASEPLPAGEVVLSREDCPAVADSTWPQCSTDFSLLAKQSLMQAMEAVQCGATTGVPAGPEGTKQAQALVKKLLPQCPL